MTDEEGAQQALEEEEMSETTQSHAEFAKEVWETLSAVNVNSHTETKGGFTYLSWNWAWNTLMSKYPASSYEFLPDFVSSEGVMVFCKLTVSNGVNALDREMWLPVLDFKNKAIAKPNPMDVNSARMRCLVKAMAMAGLGNYIYSGLNEPEVAEEDKNLVLFNTLVESEDALGLFELHQKLDQEDFGQLIGSVQGDPKSKDNPRGNKTKKHDAIWALINGVKENLIEYAILLEELVKDGNDDGVAEVVDECRGLIPEQKKFLWTQLSDHAKAAFNEHKQNSEEAA